MMISVYTLGCRVNYSESVSIEELFRKNGHEVVPFEQKADAYIINTCTVTAESTRKCRQIIRRAKRQNPEAIIAAIGCMAQTSAEKLQSMAEVDIVLGTNNKSKIVDLISESIKSRSKVSFVNDILHDARFEDIPLTSFPERDRAFVKIQEGCDRFCSYCIIPYARGPVRSRSPESVEAELHTLSENGFCEAVLTGIHVASYGRGTAVGLIELIERVHEIDGIERIRLSSVDPAAFTDEFINRAAALPKLCNHFHISLQSGCDKILKLMNRRYTTSEYKEIVEKLRRAISDVAITTDIITGFPGETDEDFGATIAFAEEIHLSGIHVFPYSERPGTVAASLEGKVPVPVRQQRADKLIKLAARLRDEFVSSFIGTVQDVLFEGSPKNGCSEGFTTNYIRVSIKGEIPGGRTEKVLITHRKEEILMGEVLRNGD